MKYLKGCLIEEELNFLPEYLKGTNWEYIEIIIILFWLNNYT